MVRLDAAEGLSSSVCVRASTRDYLMSKGSSLNMAPLNAEPIFEPPFEPAAPRQALSLLSVWSKSCLSKLVRFNQYQCLSP